jgi:peptide/nickel transport system permease protein
MTEYIIRRLLLNLLVIWIVATFVFFALRVLPGDYAAQQVSNAFFSGAGQNMTKEEALDDARERLGMNDPIPVQYAKWSWDVLRADFGRSFLTDQPAMEVTRDAVPYTLQLGFMMMVIALVVAIPVGTLSAIRQDSLLDGVFRIVAIMGLAAPTFWTASLLTLAVLRWDLWDLNVIDTPGIWEDPVASLKVFMLPALAGGLASGAVLMRMLRSQLLDVLRQDYVRTAWAKGLRERNVIIRHAFRNALIPVVTVFGFVLAAMVGGSVILERMFNIPGMGTNLYRAIQVRDVPVAQAMTLVIATGLVTINLLVDLSYFVIDPRVTVRRSSS